MKTYEFVLTLRGSGEDEESAWEDALEKFIEDPGACEGVEVVRNR